VLESSVLTKHCITRNKFCQPQSWELLITSTKGFPHLLFPCESESDVLTKHCITRSKRVLSATILGIAYHINNPFRFFALWPSSSQILLKKGVFPISIGLKPFWIFLFSDIQSLDSPSSSKTLLFSSKRCVFIYFGCYSVFSDAVLVLLTFSNVCVFSSSLTLYV
jgi:hypothetical protein